MSEQKFVYPRSEALQTGAVDASPPTLRIGDICARLGLPVTADFLQGLGFSPAAYDRAAKLYHERDLRHICAAISRHMSAVMRGQYAAGDVVESVAHAPIKTWQERQHMDTTLECTMNCSPRNPPCDDCMPRNVHVPSDHIAMDQEISELRTALNRALNQLPDGMKHCTIQFKECEHGHGALTATNWIQHPCQICRIEQLESALADITNQQKD